MKILLLTLILAGTAYAQCVTTFPGQPVCAAGKPCIQSGVIGQCHNNQTFPGQPPQCGCNVTDGSVAVPLDNNWLYSLTTPAAWWVTELPGSIWQSTLISGGWDNSVDDGLMSNPPLSVTINSNPSNGYSSYLWQTVAGTISMQITGSLNLVVQVAAAPGTVVDWHSEPSNTCLAPAKIHPFIATGNDIIYLPWTDNNAGRWWPSQSIVISDLDGNVMSQTTTLNVPLTPSNWTGVFGQSAIGDANFLNAVANANNIGLTLGGGCFAGHGIVTTSGSLSVAILAYNYQP